METGEKTRLGFGNGIKQYQQKAREALPLLIRQARAGKPIYYSELAAALKMRPRNMNYVLGAVGGELEQLSSRWKHGKIPPIQCLVINQRDQTPGQGIGWFLSEPSEFRKLTPQSKKRIIDSMLREVYDYDKWTNVLEEYDLKQLKLASDNELQQEGRAVWKRKGHGEGEAHRRLKEYIAANPSTIGLTSKYSAVTEYLFPSADILDILFKSGSSWVGVEVKGPMSDDLDLNRGLFQCVKYQALMEAEQSLLQQGINSRVILALSRDLPENLESRRVALNISVQKISYETIDHD